MLQWLYDLPIVALREATGQFGWDGRAPIVFRIIMGIRCPPRERTATPLQPGIRRPGPAPGPGFFDPDRTVRGGKGVCHEVAKGVACTMTEHRSPTAEHAVEELREPAFRERPANGAVPERIRSACLKEALMAVDLTTPRQRVVVCPAQGKASRSASTAGPPVAARQRNPSSVPQTQRGAWLPLSSHHRAAR